MLEETVEKRLSPVISSVTSSHLDLFAKQRIEIFLFGLVSSLIEIRGYLNRQVLAMSVNQLESMEALDRSGGSLERNNRGNSAGGWRPITGAQHRSAATLNPEKSPFRSAGWIRAARSPTVPILEYISRFELYI